ncbi:nuclear transport factor 2 family protein [Symmachiella dynata]|uniref:YybH family protein n=1 Tax=Symmachiella dynata TaxID=2527995 RepID=UPI0030ED9F06
MSKYLFPALVLAAAGFSACCLTSVADEPSKPQENHAAIQESAEKFTKAFNAGDAATIAAQFTENAEYLSEDGSVIAGREAILEDFTETFKQSPGLKIETTIESIRFLGKGVAIEKGTTWVTRKEGDEPIQGGYAVLHVNTGEGWQIAHVREIAVPQPSNYHRLKELEWMVGDWVDEGNDSLVVTSCRWSKNKNFLLRSFKVRIAGRDALEGTTRIGWDAEAKKIRSWTFDDAGGFAQGFWTNDGDRWIVKMNGIVNDGQIASATNVFTYIDSNTCTWQSMDRVRGDEVMPNIDEITIVRQPPPPQIDK